MHDPCPCAGGGVLCSACWHERPPCGRYMHWVLAHVPCLACTFWHVVVAGGTYGESGYAERTSTCEELDARVGLRTLTPWNICGGACGEQYQLTQMKLNGNPYAWPQTSRVLQNSEWKIHPQTHNTYTPGITCRQSSLEQRSSHHDWRTDMYVKSWIEPPSPTAQPHIVWRDPRFLVVHQLACILVDDGHV